VHHSGLSDDEVTEIKGLWAERTTIARLAEWYHIDQAMVRKIIAEPPRKEVTT
jgi:hypothetical protein